MRKAVGNHYTTTHYGDKRAKFRRVQYGFNIHQNIATSPSRTTVLLFFSCSLQENDCQPGQDVPLLDHSTIDAGGFVSHCTLAATRLRLPRIRVFPAGAVFPANPLHPHALYPDEAQRPADLRLHSVSLRGASLSLAGAGTRFLPFDRGP